LSPSSCRCCAASNTFFEAEIFPHDTWHILWLDSKVNKSGLSVPNWEGEEERWQATLLSDKSPNQWSQKMQHRQHFLLREKLEAVIL
jgi:hypothetical protein